MGDFLRDSAVHGADGRYVATLESHWEIWGPFGGYVAAIALRAAGRHSRLSRPASFACHYLGVASFDEVQLETETLRATKRAESIRVSMRQGDRRILEALVWTTTGDAALEHEHVAPPDVPKPQELKPVEEYLTPEELERGFRFWSNFDERPIRWIDDWENHPPMEPRWRHWIRLRGGSPLEDPFCEAGRLLMAVDVCMWPSASVAHTPKTLTHIAPSLDLHAVFHRLRPEAAWILLDGYGPVATDGLVGGRAYVWDDDGHLLASGGQQMLCRPVPARQPSVSDA